MGEVERAAAIRRLMNLYQQRGYEYNAGEIRRMVCAVMNQVQCEAEEAYLYIEEKMSELPPLPPDPSLED